MEGKLVDVKEKGKIAVLVFRSAEGLLEVSVWNDAKRTQLELGATYAFEIAKNYGKDGKEYTNLAKKGGSYAIQRVGGDFVPGNQVRKEMGYSQVKDRRITRLSCTSSAALIVSEMRMLEPEKAKAAVIDLAKSFEDWVLEVKE